MIIDGASFVITSVYWTRVYVCDNVITSLKCLSERMFYLSSNVTVSEKIDHLAQVSDVEILVPRCSALFTLRNGEVRIVIAYTVLK